MTTSDPARPCVLRAAARTWLFAVCCLAGLSAGQARGDATDDYKVALKFFEQERWESAETEFRKFIANYGDHPQTPTARLFLGQALVNQRKFNEAREVYRTYVAKNHDLPDVALARFRVAESSFFLEDNVAARDELQQYLAMHADHELAGRAYEYLGDVQLRLGDARSASVAFQRALEKSKDDAELAEQATFGLAQADARLDRPDDAAKLFQQLAAGDGEFADDARFRLGALYFEQRDYAAAAREFAALRTTQPESPLASVAELNAGYAQYYLSDFPAAIRHFGQAEQDPQYAATAGFWKGLSYKKLDDYDAAVQALTSAYDRDHEQPLAEKLLFHIGDSELRRANYARAEKVLVEVADHWPKSDRADDALHLATEAALRRGELGAAELLNRRFQQEYAGSGLQWLQRVVAGRIRLARGDQIRAATPDSDNAGAEYKAAVAVLQEVLDGSDVERTKSLARLQLARAYERLGNPQAVVDTLDPLVQTFRDGAGEAEFTDGLLLESENLLKLERYDDAARVSQLYLDSGETSRAATALALQAAAYSQSGEHEKLNVVLDRLVSSADDVTTAAVACYDAAEVAYDARQWEWAAELYQRTVSLGRDTGCRAAALSGLGYSQHEAGEHQAAAETFAAVMADYSDDIVLASTAAHMRALSLRLAGDREAAAKAYTEGLQRYAIAEGATPTPEELEAGLNAYRCAKGAARMYKELGRIKEADAAYQAAADQLAHQPPERRAERDKLLNEWALLHYEAEDYARADELFAQLAREYPDSDLADDARLYLGESRFFAGDLPAARNAFEELQNASNTDDFVRQRSLLLLLDVLADQEDWLELLKSAEQFAGKYTDSDDRWYANYRVGDAALQLGQDERAIEQLADTLAHAPRDVLDKAEWTPSLYLLLAEAYLRQKDYPRVEATIQAYRDASPKSPFLYQADEILGRSYKNRALFAEAREAFTRVTDSETGNHTETAAKAQFHIAETYLIEKNYEAALAEYYKVYVNYGFPEWQAPALFQAAQCDAALKNWDGAVKSYESLIKEFPKSEFADRAKPLLEAARKKVNS